MNLIDTADVYGLDYNGSGFGGNEELLGKVLAQAPGLRDRMVLATKAASCRRSRTTRATPTSARRSRPALGDSVSR